MKKFSCDNVMRVEMDFDQMFHFRPLPKMSAYKTPIKNLYLSRSFNPSRRRVCRVRL
jgi:hypothetical protein